MSPAAEPSVGSLVQQIRDIMPQAEVSAERLAGVGLAHLNALLDVARKLSKFEKGRLIFRIALPELALNGEMAQRVAGSRPEELARELGQVVTARATRLLVEIAPAIFKTLPANCKLNKTANVRTVSTLLQQGVETADLERRLREQIEANPEQLLIGYPQWADERASHYLQVFKGRLQSLVPEGCVLETEACLAMLKELMHGKMPQQLQEEQLWRDLSRHVEADRSRYVAGFTEALDRQTEEGFVLLEGAHAPGLPEGCRLNRKRCLAELKQLFQQSMNLAQAFEILGQRIAADPTSYVKGYAKLQARQAQALYEQIERLLSSNLPAGCTLNGRRCRAKVEALLEKKKSPERVVELLARKIKELPAEYLEGYGDFLRSQASQIFAQIEPHLRQALPPGCLLKKDACIAAVAGLLEQETPAEQLVEKFMSQLSAEPLRFTTPPPRPRTPPPPPPSPEKQAVEILSQLATALKPSLPPGCNLNANAFSLILSLLKDHTPPERLVQQFMEALNAKPFLYVEMPDLPRQFDDDRGYATGSSLGSG